MSWKHDGFQIMHTHSQLHFLRCLRFESRYFLGVRHKEFIFILFYLLTLFYAFQIRKNIVVERIQIASFQGYF